MRALISTVVILSMSCKSDPAGFWLLTLSPDEAGLSCTDSLVENFTYGYEPTDMVGSEWSIEESASYAQDIVFVEILMTGKDQAVLVWGEETWPGTRSLTQWDFGWTTSSSSESTSTHIAGYSFTDATTDSGEDGLSLVIDGEEASGQLTSTTTSQVVWEESDVWSETLSTEIGQTGSIPSSSYLVEMVPGSGGETSVYNLYSSAECDAEPCRIQIDSTCTQTWDFTAVLTESTLQYSPNGGSAQ